MKNYRIKYTPIDNYSFFKEKFEILDDNKKYYKRYSFDIPNQITVVGATLELLLKKKGYWKPIKNYKREDKKVIEKYVGSFFNFKYESDEQKYGKVKKISPVYICGKEQQIYIKNKIFINGSFLDKKVDSDVKSSINISNLKTNSKKYVDNLINIDNFETRDDVFKLITTPHVKLDYDKHKKGQVNDIGSYHEIESYSMETGFSFAVDVELSEEIGPNEIEYLKMGSKNSIFKVEINEIKSDNLYIQRLRKSQYLKKFKEQMADENIEFIISPSIISSDLNYIIRGNKQSMRPMPKYENKGENVKINIQKKNQSEYKFLIQPGSYIIKNEQEVEVKSLDNGIVCYEKKGGKYE